MLSVDHRARDGSCIYSIDLGGWDHQKVSIRRPRIEGSIWWHSKAQVWEDPSRGYLVHDAVRVGLQVILNQRPIRKGEARVRDVIKE